MAATPLPPKSGRRAGLRPSGVERPILIPAFRPDGSVIDLANPRPEDIDFGHMANGLSKLARFNGIYGCQAYSVAQHSVMGADALYRETGDTMLAGYFVLHDGHKHLSGDITRPMVDLIEHHHVALQRRKWPGARSAIALVKEAVEAAKRSIDVAIFKAADIADLKLMPIYARQVKEMDDRMLRAEELALFGPHAQASLVTYWPSLADLPQPKLTGTIRPWGAMKAEEAFIDRLERYLGIVVRAS